MEVDWKCLTHIIYFLFMIVNGDRYVVDFKN